MTETETEDREANLFAMYLLMPEEFVRDEIGKIKNFNIMDDKHVADLARKFKVSVPMMAYRLGMIFENSPQNRKS